MTTSCYTLYHAATRAESDNFVWFSSHDFDAFQPTNSGAVGWAIASIVLGPFIDIFGFEVIFGFALISLAFFFITLILKRL